MCVTNFKSKIMIIPCFQSCIGKANEPYSFILSDARQSLVKRIELTKASKRYMLTGLSRLLIARAIRRPSDKNIETIRSDGLENKHVRIH